MCSPSSSSLAGTREASHDGPSTLRRQARSYTTRRDVTVDFAAADEKRSLALAWDPVSEHHQPLARGTIVVRRRDAQSVDGRVWAVYDAEFPSPSGMTRAHKATAATTPVAVALELGGKVQGMLYAGLPVAAIDLPLRANAQFDPIASRQAVATNAWNLALVPLVAQLWCHAAIALFSENPQAAWRTIPVGGDESRSRSPVVAELHTSLVEMSRAIVAELAKIEADSLFRRVGGLAHEAPELEGKLTGNEIARLAGLEATLPPSARDHDGRWRLVLDDWRAAGGDVAVSVTILDALRLLQEPDFVPSRVVALAAVALDHGLEDELATSPCIVQTDGTRSAPPKAESLDFLVSIRSGLAIALGLGTPLHECHLTGSSDARALMGWLERRGSILPAEDRAVLTRLAEAGKSGMKMHKRIDDAALVAVRDALESMGRAEWTSLIPDIGRTIVLEGYHYDNRGHNRAMDAAPMSMYLGRSIDKERDSFAVAADKAPGLMWVAPRYANVLRSSLGRQGLGALKFLRLLGAETSPRIDTHPGLERKYASSSQRGLLAFYPGTPRERSREITALGGDHTLEDSASPDLEIVLQHIAADKKPTRRRARAAALISALARAWSTFDEHTEVSVVEGYHNWNYKGVTRSWWLWRAATTAWLDDDTGKPRRPIDLRLRRPATLALYGNDPTGFLHRHFKDARTDVLNVLGIAGEPSTADLCDGLMQLRDKQENGTDVPIAPVLYKAIADHLARTSHTRGDLTPGQLKKAFDNGVGLVHTNLGWRKPSEVFCGRPIFGDRAPFAPSITGADRLWRVLGIKTPGTQECIAELAAIARERSSPTPATQTVLLETQRELASLMEQTPTTDAQARRLKRLAVWTTSGWSDTRPVYAVHDPVLAVGLSQVVSVWLPGGELAQFSGLFKPLALTEVPASAGEIVDADAEANEDLTEILRSAIGLLHDDLVRNDPITASSLRIPWPEFGEFDVAVSQNLTVRVQEVVLATGPVEVAVSAKAAASLKRIYVDDGDLLGRLDGGGRAIAGLFDADHRRVAQAWLAAMESALANEQAEGLRLAEERALEETRHNDALIEMQTLSIQQQVNARRALGTARPGGGRHQLSSAPQTTGGNSLPPRVLVDPSKYRVVNPDGEIVGTSTPPSPRPHKNPLPLREPRRNGEGPQQRSSQRAYTDLEKETTGLTLARHVLQRNDLEMVDLRAQRGVGADAMDDLRQFYELKVYAGAEPDEVRLTDSEFRRAIDETDFFLVVVSGVEEGSAEHTVRIIAQPLRQLRKLDQREFRLGGIREARSLLYRLSADTDADAE